MKWKKIKDLKRAIYPFEGYQKNLENAHWGEPRNFASCTGEQAIRGAKDLGITISGKLIPDARYIFRYSKNGDKLIPGRVSMHPKTMENLKKGSNKYGYGHIMAEISWEEW